MTTKTESVSLGRARLPKALATQLTALPPGLRGRVVALVLLAHVQGLDLKRLVIGVDDLRRLAVVITQSLRISGGRAVDAAALQEAAQKVNALWP